MKIGPKLLIMSHLQAFKNAYAYKAWANNILWSCESEKEG